MPLQDTDPTPSFGGFGLRRLCLKLGEDSTSPKYIFAEPRVGYRMAKGETAEREDGLARGARRKNRRILTTKCLPYRVKLPQ